MYLPGNRERSDSIKQPNGKTCIWRESENPTAFPGERDGRENQRVNQQPIPEVLAEEIGDWDGC